MRTSYPTDNSPLPRVFDEKPGVYLGHYTPVFDLVEGWIIQPNKKGQKVNYLYRVHWVRGQPWVEISVADINKGYSFSDRDFRRDRNSPIRDLKGLPEKHAKDAREFAIRVSSHIRELYFEDIDFLTNRISQFASKLAEEVSTLCTCVLFRDVDWLIERMNRHGREYFSARHMKNDRSFQDAISELGSRYQQYRDNDVFDAQNRLENATLRDLDADR